MKKLREVAILFLGILMVQGLMAQERHTLPQGQVTRVNQTEAIGWIPANQNLGALLLAQATFEQNFESLPGDLLPSSWTSSLDANGGFYIGNYQDANLNGFWNVPLHGKFAMTNDDVCNCNLQEDLLILPVQNFSSKLDMAICFSIFDNGNNGQSTVLEIDTGSGWNPLLNIQADDNWQELILPLTGTNGHSSVALRFRYSDGGTHASGVAIDDLVIAPLNNNDLEISSPFFNQSIDPSSSGFYSLIPYRQALSNQLRFGSEVRNVGINTQSNAFLNISVSGPETYNHTEGNATIAPFSQGFIDHQNGIFTPQSLGVYTVEFEAGSVLVDDNLSNNSISTSFEVTDSIFARDNGNYTGSGVWAGSGAGWRMANQFDIVTKDTLTSVSVFLHTGTTSGSNIRFHLYGIDLQSPPIVSSPTRVLDFNSIGSWAHFTFPETNLNPGRYHLVVEAVSGTVFAAIDPLANDAPPQTSFLRISGSNVFNAVDFIPFLRMNTKVFDNPCPVVINANVSPISCFGDANGAVKVHVNGIAEVPTFLWSNANTTDSIGGLSQGLYTVTISYGSCQAVESFDLQEPGFLSLSINASGEVCGDGNGTLTPLISGGTPPFTGIWSDGQQTPSATQLAPGTYQVTITDAHGCTENQSVTIGGTPAADANLSQVLPSCGQADGTITIVPISGPGPYQFKWSHDIALLTGNAASLVSDVYQVTFTDVNNCVKEFSTILPDLGAPTLTSEGVTDALCAGEASGGIQLGTSGGSMPYSWSWSDPNGSTSEDLSNAASGNYFVTVTDNLGCRNFLSDSIWEPDSIQAEIEELQGLECFNDSNAVYQITASGGVPGYSYKWFNRVSDSIDSTVYSGNHSVTVTDGNGCESAFPFIVNPPDSIKIQLTSLVNDDSTSGYQGAVFIEVNGGSAPYAYIWSNDSTTVSFSEDIANIPGGNYEVRITDSEGCNQTARFFVGYPTGIKTILTQKPIRLFPNPVSSEFRIEFPKENGRVANQMLRLYTNLGQMVLEQKLIPSPNSPNSSQLIKTGDLPTGLYFLVISGKSGSSSIPLILE